MSDATPKPCLHCRKPTQDSANFCSWDCSVERAKSQGAVAHQPNGAPVRCITARGLLLECEHGDHVDYKFTVKVEGDEHPEDLAMGYVNYPETHAFIYTDGTVALTLYECTYYLWHLGEGELISCRYEFKGARLSEASRRKILTYWNDRPRSVIPNDVAPFDFEAHLAEFAGRTQPLSTWHVTLLRFIHAYRPFLPRNFGVADLYAMIADKRWFVSFDPDGKFWTLRLGNHVDADLCDA